VQYHWRIRNTLWVEVIISKFDEGIETRKIGARASCLPRPVRLLLTAMIHYTIAGLDHDEPPTKLARSTATETPARWALA
jgi:hypothetical protein